MNKIWLISDTHFNHEKIIEYCNRPFKNVNDMNENIIKNWNSVVKNGDKVYHLGDFGFGSKEQVKDIVSQLNGDIYLIRGNHCNHPNQWYRDCGFKEVYDKPIVFEEFYILSHEPMPFIEKKNIFKNIHGHVHNHRDYSTFSSNLSCVCVERHNYTPIDFENIKMNINTLEVSNADK